MKNFFGHCASHSRLFASHCDACDGDEISGRCDEREELNETESKIEEAEKERRRALLIKKRCFVTNEREGGRETEGGRERERGSADGARET